MKREDCQRLREEGKSYREISRITNIPLSTVFLWTKTIELTDRQTGQIRKISLDKLQKFRQKAQKIKSERYKARNNICRNIGRSIINKISSRNINGIIAALYWGEGFKKDRRLGLANSDPQIIRLFIYWLIKVVRVPREQIRLRVGINFMLKDRIEVINEYWSNTTNIPLIQFQKPFYQKTKMTRIYPNIDNYYGVFRIRANGQNDTFQKLLGMVEKLKLETIKLDLSDID
jgi:hypothetical protein